MAFTTPSVMLNGGNLPDLGVAKPTYDRAALRPAIVHIGVGGFHRAHLATYIDELCSAGHTDWAIVGSGILEGDSAMAAALAPQSCLYTLITRDADKIDVRVIGSIVDYVLAWPEASDLIERIAAPTTQIVSLTVTEGGYPIDDTTGAYEADSSVAGPGSVFDIIAVGLQLRKQRELGAITVLSCDNIVGNGGATRMSVLGEAARIDPALVQWIDDNTSFPNSMVDRITPGTAPADGDWLREHHNIDDGWPVVTEPFRQWVIEDHFAGDRLPLEELDVIITDNVEPYEQMKLRLLNAGHSCLAYLAALDGIETVHEAMADPHICRFVEAFLHREAKSVLPSVEGIDLDEYIASLIERFSNPQIGDQIARLCLDGSAKFPKFLLPTVRAQLAAGGPTDLSALALAGWCDYLLGSTYNGEPIELSADPHLATAVDHAKLTLEEPSAFLAFKEVFDDDLPASAEFAASFSAALSALRTVGLRSTIDQYLSGE